jgi:ABC-type uncharacterized transport system permease subunit
VAGSGQRGQQPHRGRGWARRALAFFRRGLVAALGCAVGVLALVAVILLLDGDPRAAVDALFEGAAGSSSARWSTLAVASVLWLAARGAPFDPDLLNSDAGRSTVGRRLAPASVAADGQILVGMFAAAIAAVELDGRSRWLVWGAAFLGSAVCGWGLARAIRWGARGDRSSEFALGVLANLMAVGAVIVLTSPGESLGPVAGGQARPVPQGHRLPEIVNERGSTVALAVVGVLAVLGFGKRFAAGRLNPPEIDPANLVRQRVGTSGALMGVAGAILALGWVERLSPFVLANLGLGYLALAVMALAGGSGTLTAVLALVFGGLVNGGLAATEAGVVPIGSALVVGGTAALVGLSLSRSPVAAVPAPPSRSAPPRPPQRRRPRAQAPKPRRRSRAELRKMSALQRTLELDPEIALTWDEKDELESINAGRWADPGFAGDQTHGDRSSTVTGTRMGRSL